LKTTVILMLIFILPFLLINCRIQDNPEHTGMPDPEHIRIQQTVEKVNIVYGTKKTPITLHKPDKAYFEILPAKALDAGNRVSLKANDASWRADICSFVFIDDGTSGEPFVEYYYQGTLSDPQKEFETYHQDVTELGIKHQNQPVKCIKSTYQKVNDKQIYESYFVGFEFEDTVGEECVGRGLLGFQIYMRDRLLSQNELKNLFNQLFYMER